MIDLEKIKKHYSEFSTEKLIDIAKIIKDLNPDIQPILIEELKSRGEYENTLKEKRTEALNNAKKGLNHYGLFNNKQKNNDLIILYIAERRKEKVNFTSLKEEIKDEFNIDNQKSELLINKYKKRGRGQIALGIFIIILGLILLIISLITNGPLIFIPFKFIFGGILIRKGLIKQK